MNETIVKHLNFGEDAKKTVFNGIDKLTKAHFKRGYAIDAV